MTYKSNSKTPNKRVMDKIRSAFDADALKRVCESNDFTGYATYVALSPDERTGRQRFYYYADNGADVLAVAHLDHVQADGTCNVIDTAAGLMAVSGALDDRLGAYVILDLLPKLGVKVDWLLTTDEELGASTADEFAANKDYNWIIEFDRGGTDVVMYDYETPELVALVEACGARVGTGSFSDICVLEHLGCSGLNWGVGYQDYHGPRSHAWLEDTFRMVAYFLRFYKENADTYLHHDPEEWWLTHGRNSLGGWGSSSGWNDAKDGWETCAFSSDADTERLNEWLKKNAHNRISEGGEV